jgi:hypothetical protein
MSGKQKTKRRNNERQKLMPRRQTKMQDYTSSITAKISANEAFDRIAHISDWWTAGVQGSSRNLGDQFTVRWGETFVTFKVTELVPGKRAVWLVTDCNLNFIADKTE